MWCNLWGMKLNVSKTKTMIVCRSRTVHPQLTQLTLDGTVLKESADLVVLGVTLDAEMSFEKHFRAVSRAGAQRLCIMRKSFHDRSLLLRSFRSFVLPVWSIAQECGAQLPTHTINYWTKLSGALVFLLVVF